MTIEVEVKVKVEVSFQNFGLSVGKLQQGCGRRRRRWLSEGGIWSGGKSERSGRE